jgi:glycosyltransferase involved in cell wall biosynthesis
MIGGLRACGFDVKPFIVGDRVPPRWRAEGSEKKVNASFPRRCAADIVRLALAARNGRRAWRELGGSVDLVYERFGLYQALGRRFHQRGVPWILETNAPLSLESSGDRRSLAWVRLARAMEQRAYKSCDAIVCISQALRDVLRERFEIEQDKVIIVPNGVDTAVFDPAKHRAVRVFSGLTVGFVGSLFEWQGLNTLLEAVARIQDAGEVIYVVIVGDGPARPALERNADILGIGRRVRFAGPIAWDDVPAHILGFDLAYSGQTVLRTGSLYLSPLKLYEYMAMARPVVASTSEDAKRLIVPGETGFLFRPGDADGLTRALGLASQRASELPSMGERARANILNRHDWASRARGMMEELVEVLPQAGFGSGFRAEELKPTGQPRE